MLAVVCRWLIVIFGSIDAEKCAYHILSTLQFYIFYGRKSMVGWLVEIFIIL
jgi:hypothetical protein